MKFAVITPYFSETLEQLQACHASVAGQSIAASAEVLHIMVFDAGREPHGASIPGVIHLALPCNSADTGATPRGIGMAMAWTIPDVEAVLFLDGDNTFEPGHIEALWDVQRRTGADIVTCARKLIRPDGSLLGTCTESNGIKFNDTNCYLVTRSAWPLIAHAWLCQPRDSGLWADRLVWNAILASDLRIARSTAPTVNYYTLVESHYRERGEEPPRGARNTVMMSGQPVYLDAVQIDELLAEKARRESGRAG